MQTIQKVSPLESLVVMELTSIQLEQERLSQLLPVLALNEDPEKARLEFEDNLATLQHRSKRLERMLDSMSSWGADECDTSAMSAFRGELTAA